MATVLKARSVSIRGAVYDIFLDNGAPDAGGLDIKVLARSTRIKYQREQSDVDGHLLTSKAETTFWVETAAQTAVLQGLTAANELQYRLRILRGGQLHWVGFVLLDLVRSQFGGGAYRFKVVATDGIARLKDIDYDQGAQDEYISFKDHFFHILDKIPLADYYTAGTEYLRTHGTLWPTELTPAVTVDALTITRVGFKALRTVDERGQVKYQSYYQALLELLKVLNARLVYSRGRYVITETADYSRQGTGVTFHRYDVAGSALTRETLINWEAAWMREIGDLTNEDALAHANGERSYLAPLRAVQVTYKHYSRQNLIPGYSGTLTNNTQVREILNFGTNGGNGTLAITGGISCAVTDQASIIPENTPMFVRLAVRIDIVDADDVNNGASLSRPVVITANGFSYQPTTWVTDAIGSLAFFVIPMAPRNVTSGTTSNFSIQTPPVPRAGTLRFSIIHQGVFVLGTQYDPSTIRVTLNDMFMESILNGSIADQYNYSIYRALGSSAVTNSVELEREHLFGDGPDDNSFGRIEYLDANGDWLPTTNWRRWAAGQYLTTTPERITELVAKMTLALQDGPRDALNLTLIAPDYHPEYLFRCSSNLYLIDEATHVIDRDEWNGRWFQVAFNFSTAVVPVVNTNDFEPGEVGGPVPPDPPTPDIGDFDGAIVPPGLAVAGFNLVPNDIETGFNAGDQVDSISVANDTDTVPLFAGDVFLLTNPITGELQEVTVAYDGGLGVPAPDQNNPPGNAVPYYGDSGSVWMIPSTTDVAVESFSAGVDIPASSYVQQDPAFTAQLSALLRTTHLQAEIFGFTEPLTTGFAGWFWRPSRRLGWRILKVHFAFGQDNGGTAKVNLKYYDATGFRYTVATHNAGGLGSVQDAFATVQAGYYRVEVESTSGSAPHGLTVTIEMIKRL